MRSRFEIICFAHEDILFHTPNWGQKVVDTLSDASIGLVGVVGSKYKATSVSAWWSVHGNTLRGQVIHPSGGDPHHGFDLDGTLADVVVIDGLFMVSRKQQWQEYRFDAVTFNGFHFYDVDWSASISKHFRVVVVDIVIEHLSGGNTNRAWLDSAIAFHKKWKHRLPYYTGSLSMVDQAKSEVLAVARMIKYCRNETYPIAWILWPSLSIHRPYSAVVWIFGMGFLLYKTQKSRQLMIKIRDLIDQDAWVRVTYRDTKQRYHDWRERRFLRIPLAECYHFSCECRSPLLLITIAFNRADMIRHQLRLLPKYPD